MGWLHFMADVVTHQTVSSNHKPPGTIAWHGVGLGRVRGVTALDETGRSGQRVTQRPVQLLIVLIGFDDQGVHARTR